MGSLKMVKTDERVHHVSNFSTHHCCWRGCVGNRQAHRLATRWSRRTYPKKGEKVWRRSCQFLHLMIKGFFVLPYYIKKMGSVQGYGWSANSAGLNKIHHSSLPIQENLVSEVLWILKPPSVLGEQTISQFLRAIKFFTKFLFQKNFCWILSISSLILELRRE